MFFYAKKYDEKNTSLYPIAHIFLPFMKKMVTFFLKKIGLKYKNVYLTAVKMEQWPIKSHCCTLQKDIFFRILTFLTSFFNLSIFFMS